MPARRRRRSNRFYSLFVVIFLLVALLAEVTPAQSGSGTHAVVVHADKKIGTINPNIYGHFAEHLGHCIEEGIWKRVFGSVRPRRFPTCAASAPTWSRR
ncbi:MAG: hypothetical protein ACYS21_20320 [Planctomycetota bacterium]|jgi:hypothetical protein